MAKKILILVGSENDREKVKEGLDFLKEMEVPFLFDIASAHRNPKKAIEYAEKAKEEGFEVIIAACGLAAHLPGLLAAHTSLPVIGVPLSAGLLSGIDALLSILQMPKGTPVATVGIDNIKNACILAMEILALKYEDIYEKLESFRKRLKEENERSSAISTLI